ncbi:MAG: alpha amylase C-terminal domain-containing protein [Myxococcales bacterium]|nr:alpha amylase C-terminal domain-containing protein [Myxococcales bacterium]
MITSRPISSSLLSSPLLVAGLLALGPGCMPDDGSRTAAVAPEGDRGHALGPVAGALPYDGGTTFRVWAPHAERVSVVGDFNGWQAGVDELLREPGGDYFSADVDGPGHGDAYEYVIHRGDQQLRRADPRARQMIHSSSHGVIVDPSRFEFTTTGFQMPQWNDAVIYELHVGTFNDQPGGGPGTWSSAIERLDALARLGVNVIEVMPPAEFAGDFSWGYNTAYPFAPESAYGSPDDAKRFIDQAHARGIAVVIDVVHNHYGPSDLSMWCFDGECLGEGNGGVYFFTDWRQETDWGPRPDYGRVEVRDFIASNVALWLHEYQADGLRWDSTVNIRRAGGGDIPEGWSVMQRANDLVDADQPWKLMIAEDLQDDPWLTKPTGQGGAGFDAQWDGRFFHPINHNLVVREDHDRDMHQVRDAIAASYDGQATRRVIYTESHDEVANGRSRIPEMIWPGHADSYFSKKRAMLGVSVVMTSPGIPMLFQGQECLEDGFFHDDDPVDWAKCERFAGLRTMVQDLVHLRRNLAGHTAGLHGDHVNVFHVNDGDEVVAYHRWDRGGPGDDVVVVANFSATAYPHYEIGLPRGGSWHVRFNGDWRGYDEEFGDTPSLRTTAHEGGKDGLGYHGAVGVGPYGVVILSQE